MEPEGIGREPWSTPAVGVMGTIGDRNQEHLHMQVAQLFVETLIDIDKKLYDDY